MSTPTIAVEGMWTWLCSSLPHDIVTAYSLNLSILLSGGGETKQSTFSHGEWTRALSPWELHDRVQRVVHMFHQLSCRSNTYVMLAREGECPFRIMTIWMYGRHCASRILSDLIAKGWYNSSAHLYMSEFGSKQVPWGSCEKNFGNIVTRAFNRYSFFWTSWNRAARLCITY